MFIQKETLISVTKLYKARQKYISKKLVMKSYFSHQHFCENVDTWSATILSCSKYCCFCLSNPQVSVFPLPFSLFGDLLSGPPPLFYSPLHADIAQGPILSCCCICYKGECWHYHNIPQKLQQLLVEELAEFNAGKKRFFRCCTLGGTYLFSRRVYTKSVAFQVPTCQIYQKKLGKPKKLWFHVLQWWVAKLLPKHRKWCHMYSNKSVIRTSTVTSIV